MDVAIHVFNRLERVVEVIEQEGEAEAGTEREQERD